MTARRFDRAGETWVRIALNDREPGLHAPLHPGPKDGLQAVGNDHAAISFMRLNSEVHNGKLARY
jgi:hypothetical protein